MKPERYRQIDELFEAVLDLPETEREAFLSRKANGDENLKREVLSLLKAQIVSNNFLEKSAMGIAAKNLADERTVGETRFFGKTIGTYKIERLLGAAAWARFISPRTKNSTKSRAQDFARRIYIR